MKQIRKFAKQALKNVVKFVNESYSTYIVYNPQTGGTHYAWTRKEAMAWMACYDSADFGPTELRNFWDNKIAKTMTTSAGTALLVFA